MIIDYTYGAIAQNQTYFGLGYYDTQSTVALIIIVVTPDDRTIKVNYENRISTVNIENRILEVDEENRIFIA